MNLAFTGLAAHPPGTIADLLIRSYAELLRTTRSAPRPAACDAAGQASDLWHGLAESLRAYDAAAYANPGTVGRALFVTTLDGKPVGMASWDPRGLPALVELGHNCVLPDYQGRGIGHAQIREALRRIAQLPGGSGCAVEVTTDDHPFFLPALHQYLACGFVELRRWPDEHDPRHRLIRLRLEHPWM